MRSLLPARIVVAAMVAFGGLWAAGGPAGLIGGIAGGSSSAGTRGEASAAGQSGGWLELFNGKDLTGWQNAAGGPPGAGWVVQDGAMVRNAPAGDIWTTQKFADFVLDLEFKTEGNSGVFIRTGDPRNCVQTGLEMQVLPPARMPSKNSCGSIYDAQAPSKELSKKGEWNHVVITAIGSRISVEMNGQQVIDMDLDRWTTPGRNPDGTKNKYRKALKDFPREGYIGLQDHGAKVAYRNLKIKPLEKK
ncbi:MAG: 3-keto-disaccharide hydrolase [Thermoguttaceae bacterium]